MSAGPATLRAVLFDMDGTLVDTERHWDVALNELAVRLGGALSTTARAAITGSSVPTALQLLYADVGAQRDAAEQAGDDRWLQARVADLMRTSVDWRPGAVELLHAVGETDLRTALVTTTFRELTDIVLRHIGADRFDVTVCGDEVAATKPDPAPYLQAMAALGVEPGGCVVVEDSLTGVTSGLSAGASVLGVPSLGPVPAQPGLVVRDSLVGVSVDDLRALVRDRDAVDAG